MTYRLLADALVVAHLLFIVFALLGGLLAFWRPWTLLLHLPAALWICLIEFRGGICPLTPLENSLRSKAGQQGYSESFVEHYLIPVIYPPGLDHHTQLILGCIALCVNVAIYTLFIRFARRSRPPRDITPD